MSVRFANRTEAGRQLAAALRGHVGSDPVVVGLPRGGVPVAFEVAVALRVPLDVIVVRKLGIPFHPELAMGAIGEQGARVVDEALARRAGVSARQIEVVEQRERAELDRRVRRLRGQREPVSLAGKEVVIVDDGVATGATARAACHVARDRGARRVVLATPVGPETIRQDIGPSADAVVCVRTPPQFSAVGAHYDDFGEVSDDDVADILARANRAAAGTQRGQPADGDERAAKVDEVDGEVDGEVAVPIDGAVLAGHLTLPRHAPMIVAFAHGSGSSRHSPRNRYVAKLLNSRGIGTLLFDLLTANEERDRDNVFDIALLGGRLGHAIGWLQTQPAAQGRRIGLFGASTGAAAALWAAAENGADSTAGFAADEIVAIVSRGGRPDLAGDRLASVRAPTLLVVGGRDPTVLELNRAAQAQLRCENRLEVVPGATHLFEEPGALEFAARLAADWFEHHAGAERTAARDTGGPK